MQSFKTLAYGLAAVGVALGQAPMPRTEVILHNFTAPAKGANPFSGLTYGPGASLFGTTAGGGSFGLGIVYKIGPGGKLAVLYNFTGGDDGANPQAGLTVDGTGHLYGTAAFGGTFNAGVVYKVTPEGKETVLYNFTGGADGNQPLGGVTFDGAGNLYGTTYSGGAGNGVVYKLAPDGTETVQHTFAGSFDGRNPFAGVTIDAAGNIYGTTPEGGTSFDGIVYKIDTAGKETILHSFTGGSDGGLPFAGVILGPAGDLYGAAQFGGSGFGGVLYKIDTAGNETVLYNFSFGAGGSNPASGLIFDSAGNLYGTTNSGGLNYGVIYKIDPAGHETVLFSFPGGTGGGAPQSGVIRSPAGELYGTTISGGAGYGVVYKVSAVGEETVLYSFPGVTDGLFPFAGVIRDAAGNLYGTTESGGTSANGTVFNITPTGTETVLHSFTGGTDGAQPISGVARDAAGNLYGTTQEGGASNFGVVYKVGAAGEESIIYSFTGGSDGGQPYAGVTLDESGNLYGTTTFGGSSFGGVVYKLTQAGDETVLYNFTGGADGGEPYGGVTLDAGGNIYGTAGDGGTFFNGVVFKIDPSGAETVLYNFTGGADGGRPFSGVILDPAGNIYGTTPSGGSGFGVVYKLDPSGVETVLHTFTGGADGGDPQSGVVRDRAGNLYGAAPLGNLGFGVVYKLDTANQESVLYSFSYGRPGSNPNGAVIIDSSGNLYGTAEDGGGKGGGLVFELPAP